jgi:adenosylcobyric acid synthase
MLGRKIADPAGVDGSREGLGLLPLETVFSVTKQTERTATRFGQLQPPWAGLSGKAVTGYQIRHGRTEKTGPVAEVLPDGLAFADGPVLGIYLHGLFEHTDVLEALFGEPSRRSLEEVFDALADAVEAHLDITELLRVVIEKRTTA